MKNVISTTLFDEHARYQPYLPAAIRAHHNLFRGWVYRIYHDHLLDAGPYGRALRALAERGLVELSFVSSEIMIEKALLWRMLPLWDDEVERFILRDIDMVACYRERRIEEVWIRSGLAVHSLSDRKGHHEWPALNGMMGFHVPQARPLLDAGAGYDADTMEKLLARAKWPDEVWCSNYRASGKGADPKYRMCKSTTNNQYFLGMFVWPRVQSNACEHRLNGCGTYEGTKMSRTEVDPFEGEDLGVPKAIREGSDVLIPFIGASEMNSSIDLAAIVRFYQAHGDPEIERAIVECERP